MIYTVYRATPLGRDDEPVGKVESWCALAALEEYASGQGLPEWSVDSTRDGRLVLCPPFMRQYFYVYRTMAPLTDYPLCDTRSGRSGSSERVPHEAWCPHFMRPIDECDRGQQDLRSRPLR